MTEKIFITREIRGCISDVCYSDETLAKDRSEYQKVIAFLSRRHVEVAGPLYEDVR